MTNKEKYWEEITEKAKAFELNEWIICNVPETILNASNIYNTIVFNNWLNQEYKEPEVDMSEYIGKMVEVSNDGQLWKNRKLIYVRNNKTWNCLYITIDEDETTSTWKYCRPETKDIW